MNYGAALYQAQSGAYLSSREAEMFAFRRANQLLNAADNADSRRNALSINFKLWSLLLRGAENISNPLPDILRADIVALGAWVLIETNSLMSSARPLRSLIEINQDMIEGLSGAADTTSAAA